VTHLQDGHSDIRCDLCKVIVEWPDDVVGYYTNGGIVLSDDVHDTGHHACVPCVERLQSHFDSIHPPTPEPEEAPKAESTVSAREVVKQLRDASRGKFVWHVRDKETQALCMRFEDWEKREAELWFDDNLERHPEYHAKNELARVHTLSQTDKLMQRAADTLEQCTLSAGVLKVMELIITEATDTYWLENSQTFFEALWAVADDAGLGDELNERFAKYGIGAKA